MVSSIIKIDMVTLQNGTKLFVTIATAPIITDFLVLKIHISYTHNKIAYYNSK